MMEYQRGQVLLIVVLVMVTALTVGLSVAARTITNIRTSEEAESSEKAFSAAEAGIEQSLTNNVAVSGSFPNQATYQTTIRTISGTEFRLNNGVPVLKDDAFDLWLSSYPNYASPWSGTLTLYWGQSGEVCASSESSNTMPALELVLLSGPTNNPAITRYALDSCPDRKLQNQFELVPLAGGTVDGKTYLYRKTITVTSGIFMRIIPLYAPATMAVQACSACAALPSQGTVIEATGIAANTQRKLVTQKRYPKLPTELFPYSFFQPQ